MDSINNSLSIFGNGSGTNEVPEPDLSYYGQAGCDRIIAEAAQNELRMFDGIIMSKFERLHNHNDAINESTDPYKPMDVETCKAIMVAGIFMKFKKFLKEMWSKLIGMIDSFIDRVEGSLTKDNKDLLDKFQRTITRDPDRFKDMKFSWSEMKSDDHEISLYNINKKAEEAKSELFCHLKDITCDNFIFYIDKRSSFFILREMLTCIAKDARCLSKAIDSNSEDNLEENAVIFTESSHDFFFEDEEETTGEYTKYHSKIDNWLSSPKSYLKPIKEIRKEIDKYFSREIKCFEKLSDPFVWKKAGCIDSRRNLMMIDIFDKVSLVLYQYYTKVQMMTAKAINNKIDAYCFMMKQCRRVWNQAAYAASSDKNYEDDKSLHDAIAECADFESEQLLGY